MNNDLIIFSGPTITETEIQQVLPHACCHEPVACGDILRVLRLKPKMIVIIDGYFEQRGSVWHKEILFALEKGVTVIGASSMGALRAAELDEFGMIGIGEIYQQYKTGKIIADDEVTVTHSSNAHYGKTVTALINDRFTLQKAITAGVIDENEANTLIQQLKKLPYFGRSLYIESKKLGHRGLGEWLEHNYIDQKKKDALALLRTLASNQAFLSKKITEPFNFTFFTRKIYQEIASSPFKKAYPWLPEDEKLLIQQSDKSAIHLARLRRVLTSLSLDGRQSIAGEIDKNKLMKFYLIYLGQQSIEVERNQLIAQGIVDLFDYIKSSNYQVSKGYQQLFFDAFRKGKQLFTVQAVEEWQRGNNLSQPELLKFIEIMTVFYFIIEKNNVDYLGCLPSPCPIDENHPWFSPSG